MSGSAATGEVLDRARLNRATLARQLLLERAALPVLDAVEQVVALQAQVPNPPYLGLWSRLADFRREHLTELMESRQVVRATMLRATLQVMSARDFLDFRTPVQPALTKAMRGFMGKRAEGLDIAALTAEARALVGERPRSYGELGAELLASRPDRDASALAYITLRTHLPVVQVPPGGTWGSGANATYANADEWLGKEPSPAAEPDGLVLRYLTAFGPASAKDVQSWSGLTGLGPVLKRLRPELRVFRDDQGTELFDVPDGPLPDAGTTAPPRFLPEWDNLLLAHADRSRVIADEHRTRVYRPGARVLPTLLVDGFVAGVWKIRKERRSGAVLAVETFGGLGPADLAAVQAEGRRLLEFAEPDAAGHEVEVAQAD
ncbi:winged helix DNA-binding domain-containing protein [Saccharothrix sp. ST-888]|uniref:winged helix DNA-binding domain-containing protein n=1 Tax=Saccharothrix sp. ST-888 TaxID=1427391 RepID=UPI0005ED2924|nr:winged helix DNA-binding domain-containing protein [Saccharothrix sp. ST-888]KJK59195.1 hypothetical protein UK12_05805 [Saccharothrix sp. ST-888]